MEFYQKFKTYSNTDLLRIIDKPDNYQLQAVETAKTIIADRQLSETEIKIAKDELEIEMQEKSKKEQQKIAIENKVKDIGKSVFDQINPIQKETPTAVKTIRIISIILGGLFLYKMYKEFGMLKFMFTDSYAKWDFSMVFYFLPVIFFLTAIILFYMRKKAGWLLVTIFLAYSAISAIVLFISRMNMQSSGIEIFDNLLPKISPRYILHFLFFAGIIWVISKEKLRNIYLISKRTMILTISITILIIVLGIIIGITTRYLFL